MRTSRIRLADVLRRSDAVHEWTVQLPCTTPASQQAILQGTAVNTPWPALHQHLIAALESLGRRANLQRSTR